MAYEQTSSMPCFALDIAMAVRKKLVFSLKRSNVRLSGKRVVVIKLLIKLIISLFLKSAQTADFLFLNVIF